MRCPLPGCGCRGRGGARGHSPAPATGRGEESPTCLCGSRAVPSPDTGPGRVAAGVRREQLQGSGGRLGPGCTALCAVSQTALHAVRQEPGFYCKGHISFRSETEPLLVSVWLLPPRAPPPHPLCSSSFHTVSAGFPHQKPVGTCACARSVLGSMSQRFKNILCGDGRDFHN